MGKALVDFEGIKVYLIRNHEGKYLRSVGYPASGRSWVDKPEQAKMWTRKGPAQARITYFYNHNRELPAPELIELSIGDSRIVDLTEHLKKARLKFDEDNEKRSQRYRNNSPEHSSTTVLVRPFQVTG